MKRKSTFPCLMALLSALIFSQNVWAAGTTVQNIRVGIHKGFTRIVFDSDGDLPIGIGPVSREGISVYYEQLELLVKPKDLSRKADGAIARVSYHKKKNVSVISITFKYPGTGVKSYFLSSDPPEKGGYRLVMEFLTWEGPSPKETKLSSANIIPREEPRGHEKISKASPGQTKGFERKSQSKKGDTAPQKRPKQAAPSEVSAEDVPSAETVFSGEVGVIGRNVEGDDESAKFTEYRDFDPISGELEFTYEKKDHHYSRFTAENVGQDDQSYNLEVGRYGKFKIDLSYDEIPHRFAFDARNIYYRAATGDLRLSNTQDVAFSDRVTRLTGLMAGAEPLDMELHRKKAGLNADVLAVGPFNFRVEASREKKEGTRPFSGSLSLDDSIEIPEPIDYNTTELRFISEYANKGLYFNANYYFSMFENHIDTLTWENPFRATDMVGASSKGRIDLAPENQHHNVSVTGSYMDLPLKTRVSATAVRGWMRQNDALVPYTINTALTTPSGGDASDPTSLPKQDVDAEVITSLYNFTLTSRPWSFMHLKGRFRYFEYDNNTEQIQFPGFVAADDFFTAPSVPGATSIVNLPVSYDKTTAKLDLGLDVYKRTRFNLGYTFEKTDRTNREASRQEDNIFRGSLDTSPFSWLDLGASYERTNRDISDYDFDVYLEGGEDLSQLQGLRKYDEADMVRDRVQLRGALYPWDPIALSGSFTYGKDDFEDSPYGLLEDKHYIFSFNADLTITERVHLNGFYSYEKYKNRQKDRGEVPSQPLAVESDWFSKSEDVVNTIGAGLKAALVPDRLNLDVSYSYSHVDGKIDFFTPAVATAEFPTVDQTRLHTLNAKLKCRAWRGLSFTFGYLWEKFEYEDYNTEGFTNIPTDTGDNYNGAYLMNTLPQDYDASVIYLKAAYRW